MTWEERKDIFSKDVLTNEDIARLLHMDITNASTLACQIRRKAKMAGTIRLDMKGRVHVEDYMDFFNVTRDRYIFKEEINNGTL